MVPAFLVACLLAPPTHTLDHKQLDALIAQAQQTHSDCLVVMVDGKIVVDKWFTAPGRIEAMSATKSIVNLAIGMLIKEGKIKSVDEPVHDFFPEYKGGGKEKVTIKNLLTHTSGIKSRPNTDDIYNTDDYLKNALNRPLVSKPGATFFYNNSAVNLLSALASRAAQEPFDRYLKRKLFDRIGIRDYRWSTDKSGRPTGMSGFQVWPEDFVKIGDFLNRGGDGLLPSGWIEKSTQASEASIRDGSPCGWLWWPTADKQGYGISNNLLAQWRKAGLSEELLARVKTLEGQSFDDPADLHAAIHKCLADDDSDLLKLDELLVNGKVAPDARIKTTGVHSYFARGYLGQYLDMVPSANLVVVRMRREVEETEQEAYERTFTDFPYMVDNLGRSTVASQPKEQAVALGATPKKPLVKPKAHLKRKTTSARRP